MFPLLASLSFGQDAEPSRGVNFYSIEKEVALGRQLYGSFLTGVKLVDSEPLKAYVGGLGRRLAAQAGGPSFTYTFEVIADDPAKLHEPAAFPGGFVLVPAGLIAASHDGDELAGMLAHAIAHVAARHGTKRATREELSAIATAPLGGQRAPNAGVMQAGMAAFRRRQESEADALAVRMLDAAGIDPAGLARYVEREQGDAPGTVFAELPPRADRVAAIRKAIEGLPARSYEGVAGFAEAKRIVGR